MKTLIVYATRHGTTRECSEKLAAILQGDVVVSPVTDAPDLDSFDGVILGGPIYAGKLNRKLRSFYENHRDALLTKRLGLFICCMDEAHAEEEFRNAYPGRLLDAARAKGVLGGAFDFDRLSWFERMIVRKVAKVKESVSRISDDAIEDFAHNFLGNKMPE